MSINYINPELVAINGYSGPQEDAAISPDNQYLFFDSHNDAGMPEDIYIATRITYKSFQFVNLLPGLNMQAIEGHEDLAHNFYFVSPILLGQGAPTTMGQGIFSGGSVTGVTPVLGIAPKSAPSGSTAITFDLSITTDGNTLFFSDFTVRSSDFSPESAMLSIATKNFDGSFTRLSNSDSILQNVNAVGPLVYNATPSTDGLTLAFNGASVSGGNHIYISTRLSPSVPFGVPAIVASADFDGQLSEPGSFSFDGNYLYFHRVLTTSSSQIYVLTKQSVPPATQQPQSFLGNILFPPKQ